jgi:hypothetical protein
MTRVFLTLGVPDDKSILTLGVPDDKSILTLHQVLPK